jgi:SNF2 family DNA or RNA helicase/uncharacterized Zn finger protein
MFYDIDIKKYIEKNTTNNSLQRGISLFDDGAVLEIDFTNNNSVIAKVKGSQIYKVGVSASQSNKIISSCNCPYSYEGLCKHEVAVLFEIEKYINLGKNPKINPENSNQLVISKARRNSSEPVEILGYKNLSLNAVKQILFKSNNNYYSYDVKLKNVSSDFAEIQIKSWQNKNIIQFNFLENKLYSKCDCNSLVNGLCVHQIITLYEIVKEFDNNFFDIIKDENVRKIIEKAAEFYGLPAQMDTKSVFKVIFQNKKLIAEPIGEAIGLIPVNEKFVTHKNIINSVTQEFNRLSFSSQNRDFELGFVFYIQEFDSNKKTNYRNHYKTYNNIEFLLISGKLNKTNTKLINPIRKFSDYDAHNIQLSSSDEELLKLSEFTSESFISNYINSHDLVDSEYENAVEKLIAKHYETIMPKIKKLLISKPFIYRTFSDNFSGYELHEIKISPNTVEPSFRITENDLFYSFELILTLGNTVLTVYDKNLFFYNPFILEYFSEFYFIGNLQDNFIIAESFKQKTPIKIVKNNFLVLFENYIKPVSKKYKINFELNSIPIVDKIIEKMKKQLYITELGKFILFKPFVLYDDIIQANILEHGTILEYKNNSIVESHRNFEFEKEYYDFVKKLHSEFKNQFNDNFFHIKYSDFMRNQWFLNAFESLKNEGVEVFGLNEMKNFNYSIHIAKVSVNISSGQDWFDVNIEVIFGDEHISLKDIKKAVLKNEKFIKLTDGTLGILPEEWLAKFERYLRQGKIVNDELKISKLRFSIIDELFDKRDYLEIFQEIAEKQNLLKSFSEIKNIKIPQKLNAELRDYQKAGYNWLNFLDEFGWGGILADDMGLGKTIQILTFLLKKVQTTQKASLVVLPTTLLFNWEAEIAKFAPSLKTFFYYGGNRLKEISDFKSYDLIITTYGTMTRDIEILQKYKFNYVILDESQAIKNPSSQRFKAATLLKADNRLALTGTPIENNTFDLFAQMEFLNPGFLGTQKQFKENYSDAIDKEQNPVIASELQHLINPFILRRSKEQVATELPPKIEDVIYCKMEKEQRKVYDAFRNKYRNMLLNKIDDEGLGKSKIYVLEGLMKLRQICDSPEILSDDENYGKESVKIHELIRHIKQKTGKHKMLVFSQFVKMLSVIKRELASENIVYEYLDGKSSNKARQESVEHFQSDENCRVFLISLKAGGTGLNLTAADYVYVVDPWWNPAVENQAIDRCYRIGQDKKVIAYRMICENTIEEKIMKYQAKKHKIASDIISTDENFIKQLNKSDIEDLFS